MDVEILTESCESIGSDSDQTMEIDRNHNIDKSVQCLTSLDSTTFPQVVNRLPSPSLYPYVNIKINPEIITISDSEDSDLQEAKTNSFLHTSESQTPNVPLTTTIDSTLNDDSTPAPDFDTKITATTLEPISARTRSTRRPNLISYCEDVPSTSIVEPTTSSELNAAFPKTATSAKFQVEPAQIPKNDDQMVFYSNFLYKSICFLCGSTDKNLTIHYARKHPDTEVFIARVSPRIAARIRRQNYEFAKIDDKIHGFCFFCEELKTMKRFDWIKHLLIHTGEHMYHCVGCNTSMAKKVKHANCKRDTVQSIFNDESSNGNLNAFICNTCNYIQIHENRMIKHLSEHTSFNATTNEMFSRVVLVKLSNV